MHQQYATERIEWVDVYKGLAITYVLLGHVACFLSPIVYVFHMNAFFFISGYTTSLKRNNLVQFIAEKFTTLMIPFITINLFFVGIVLLLNYSGVFNLFYEVDPKIYFLVLLGDLWKDVLLFCISVVDLGGALWFLKVLFFTLVFARILNDAAIILKLNSYVTLLISFMLFLFGHAFIFKKVYMIFEVDLCFSSLFYFWCGRFFKENDIFNKIFSWYLTPVAVLLIYYFTYINNMNIDYTTRTFKNPFFSTAATFAGVYVTYALSLALVRLGILKQIIVYIGRRTLSIMAMHFLAFRISFLLLYYWGLISIKHLQDVVPPSGNRYWHVLLISSLLIILFWDWLLKNTAYVGFVLIGNNRDFVSRITNRYFRRIQ